MRNPFYMKLIDALRRWPRGLQGSVATEFALTAPILALVAMAIIDFGGAFTHKLEMTGALDKGLYHGLANKDDLAGVEDRVEANLSTDIHAPTVTATHVCQCSDGTEVSCDGGTCDSGSVQKYIEITIVEDYDTYISWPGFDDPMELSETVKIRVE
jgi:hypothetical protein